jgi:hypothetical protein
MAIAYLSANGINVPSIGRTNKSRFFLVFDPMGVCLINKDLSFQTASLFVLYSPNPPDYQYNICGSFSHAIKTLFGMIVPQMVSSPTPTITRTTHRIAIASLETQFEVGPRDFGCFKRRKNIPPSHVGNLSFESIDSIFRPCTSPSEPFRARIHWHINNQIMAESCLTTIIDFTIDGDHKWSAFVDGGDGFFYGIPSNAPRVVKFDPLVKSLTEIGPDLGEGEGKWMCGVLANTGSIYCAPFCAEHVLKIDTIQGTVETLDDVELPEIGDCLWESGALAPDNSIYFMPSKARRIMRLNPDNDSLSSVGDDLGGGLNKYRGTVVGNDDHVYGIPDEATRIVKFDPTNSDTTSNVGEEAEEQFNCGNGVFGGDGYIYAANDFGQVLKVDATRNNYTWIGDPIYSGRGIGWGDAIVGADKCIYWPPSGANRVLKFDPETQQLPSLVGGDLGQGYCKWLGGALASDDAIYCLSVSSKQILAIDPFKELAMSMHNNFKKHPQELGCLFVKDEEWCNETFYNGAVRKFGIEKVFKCLPSDGEWADNFSGNLPLFMIAASCENSAVSVIYHLLRRNVHDALSGGNDDAVSKKRKLSST